MNEIEKKLRTKTKYYAVDKEAGIEVLSREVFKSGKEIVYPFDREGKQKYTFPSKIIFDGVSRSSLKGFYNLSFGYGLTRNLSPLLSLLADEDFTVHELWIVGDRETNYVKRKKILEVNKKDIEYLFEQIRPTREKHSIELKSIVYDLFSSKGITEEGNVTLYTSGSLRKLVNEIVRGKVKLTKADIEALQQLNELETDGLAEIKKKYIIGTKVEIENIYIESVIEEFDNLFKQKHDSEHLEGRWHAFFKKYSWIFSYLFATSVTYFDDQYYVGGQKGSGTGAQYADFIYKNSLTENNAIIEIKTHKTKLLNKSPYRKGTNVYAPSFSLVGGINQVLSQKETLLKEFSNIVRNDFKAYEPKCIVVVGTIDGLSENECRSMEMFRNNLRGVEIVSFDELRKKLEVIHGLFSKDA